MDGDKAIQGGHELAVLALLRQGRYVFAVPPSPHGMPRHSPDEATSPSHQPSMPEFSLNGQQLHAATQKGYCKKPGSPIGFTPGLSVVVLRDVAHFPYTLSNKAPPGSPKSSGGAA